MGTYSDLRSDIISATENDGAEFTSAIASFIERTELRLTKDIDDVGLDVYTTITLSANNPVVDLPNDRVRIVRNVNYTTSTSSIKTSLLQRTYEYAIDYWAVADKVLSSPGNTGTSAAQANPNTNAINAIRNMGMVPEGYYINRRFTDTDAWFVKTDVPNGTKMFVRSPLQTKMEPDFDTGNLRFKARERYSFGVSDWRGWFGSAG